MPFWCKSRASVTITRSPSPSRPGAQGGDLVRAILGRGRDAEADDLQLALGHAADPRQILGRAVAGGDDQIAPRGDPAEGGDTLRLGPVIGDGQRDAPPRARKIGDQRRRAFVAMDQVDRVARQPAAQVPRRRRRMAQPVGDAAAVPGDIARRQIDERCLALRPGPDIGGARQRHLVPMGAQPVAEAQDVPGDPAHAELRAHFQHAQRSAAGIARHFRTGPGRIVQHGAIIAWARRSPIPQRAAQRAAVICSMFATPGARGAARGAAAFGLRGDHALLRADLPNGKAPA